MTLLAVYVACFVLGGILVGASAFGGGGQDGSGADADHGGDAGAGGADTELGHADVDHGGLEHGGLDHDHDHGHAHAPPTHVDPGTHGGSVEAASFLSTFLSFRFWTFAVAAFGATGTVSTLLGLGTYIPLGSALFTGLVAGWGASTLIRRLSRDTVSTETSTRKLAGREGEVVLSVGPGKRGKVRVTHNGQWLELFATTRDDALIERGQRVLVVAVSDGTADVTPVDPVRHPPPPTVTS